MSKLDDILNYDQLVDLHREPKAIVKGNIKDLMLEIYEESKSQHGTALPNQDKKFRQLVEAL